MEPGPVLPGFESQLLPFPDWVIVGKLLNFSVSPCLFPLLQKGVTTLLTHFSTVRIECANEKCLYPAGVA